MAIGKLTYLLTLGIGGHTPVWGSAASEVVGSRTRGAVAVSGRALGGPASPQASPQGLPRGGGWGGGGGGDPWTCALSRQEQRRGDAPVRVGRGLGLGLGLGGHGWGGRFPGSRVRRSRVRWSGVGGQG